MIRKIKRKTAWVIKKPHQVVGVVGAHSKMALKKGIKNYVNSRKQPRSHRFGCGIKTAYSQFEIDKWRLHRKYPIVVCLVGEQLNDTQAKKLIDLQQAIHCHFFAAPTVAEELIALSKDDKIVTKIDTLDSKSDVNFSQLRSAIMQTHMDNDVVLLDLGEAIPAADYFITQQFVAHNYEKETDIVAPSYLCNGMQFSGVEFNRQDKIFEWMSQTPLDIGQLHIPRYSLNAHWHGVYMRFRALQNISFSSHNLARGLAGGFSEIVARAWQQNIRTLTYSPAQLTIKKLPNLPVCDFHKTWLLERNIKDKDGVIRVIYVLNATSVSGGIKTVFEHINGLKQRGFRVELWSLQGDPDWMKLDVKVRKFYNYTDIEVALRNEDALKIATWWETSQPVWVASVNHGIGVNFIQEFEAWFYPNDSQARAAVISSYRKELISTTTSSYNLDELQEIGLKNIPLIPVGYDGNIYHQQKTAKRKDHTMLAVGRSFFQKNFEFTKQAWLSIGDERPRLELFGSEPEILKDERVRYHVRPSNEEVNMLYNSSTFFVQTSRHEGFGLPIIEAMAAGCPVICTDAHGNRDFSIDEQTCLMVEHDNIPQLSEAIRRLDGDKKLQAKLRKNGMAMAKKYEWSAIIDRVSDFYRSIS